jgi:hypothetical protein
VSGGGALLEAASFLGLGCYFLYGHGDDHRLSAQIITKSKQEDIDMIYKKLALFAGGALFGSAGIRLLTSTDAKKAYTQVVAAGLRMKDTVMGTVTSVQENAADILASAKDINEQRAEQEAVIEDMAEEIVTEAEAASAEA